jgi:ubiquinone biosynthesis monooxygenase Coq7
MPLPNIDKLIVNFDRALRTLYAGANSVRPFPGGEVNAANLNDKDRRDAAALMRVNHAGEICAQALYHGQALTARNEVVQQALESAAVEETEHLAWTRQRITELNGKVSVLNPVLYASSFAIGTVCGLMGDKWNLGFLAETETQVEGHLEKHLDRLPQEDNRSRAILAQMKEDEAQHALTAVRHGAAKLPLPVRKIMRVTSKLMTHTTYWV